ncbi:MAG: discoidin domain-containing protein [Eubacterium sp.]|nr:discoidin domain-containing protein [Eubacterium sp.]
MKKKMKRLLSAVMAVVMVITLIPAVNFTVQAEEEPYNLSEGRTVYASSSNGGDTEDKAVDGKENSRWQAATDDTNEWLYVDLGTEANLDHIYMHWEAAYAKYYKIETSNDEIEWTTAYEKKKGEGQHVTMAVNYKYTGVRGDGDYRFSVNWSKVEDAHYKVYVDGEDDAHIAYAGGDNYRFTNHGGTQGDVRMSPGEHTLTVVAFNPDNNKELGRGVLDVDAQENAEGNNEIDENAADALKQTITKEKLSVTKARYVKITCTQRATGYGASLFEFQVWGTGGANKPPKNYGENLALNKIVKCSGTRDEWWMYDNAGNMKQDAYNQVKPENAVDGDLNTSFTSYQGEDNQWIYVDLGAAYNVGRIITKFNEDAGKIYDIQVSKDAKHWTTVHRELRGFMNKIDNVTCYQQGVRYVRILAYSKVESGSGVSVRELEVYEYKEGDSKDNEEIKDLPISQIVNNENGRGSYVVGEVKKELNKLPTFVNDETVKTPIDSNSWWSSFMIKTYGNMAIIHPLKAQFSNQGLGILLASQGYTDERKPQDLGVGYYSEKLKDFFIKPESFEGKSGYDRVEGYGDYHVEVGLCDADGVKMKSTLVKGSPYIFSEFPEDDTVVFTSQSIIKFYDGNGNIILANPGDSITTDHIGFTSYDNENERAGNAGSNFMLAAPEGTKFTAKSIGKNTLLKIQFANKNNAYLTAATMMKKNDIADYYQHAYAKVKDTKVTYDYNKDNSKVTTYYKATTETVRSGFSNQTMQAFYPHQWKYSTDTNAPYCTYPSIRGTMKAVFENELTTVQQFAGLLPTFAKPNSSKLENDKIKAYIKTVVDEIGTGPNADAYWQGKAVHPLAITALMADQIGETKMRDQLLNDLKKIMVDWFNYTGGEDRCYLIYNKDWGTVYYPESAYGANAAICDHHFTYGYFLFGAAVLSCYDQEFYYQYKDMVELILRDYANPEEPEDDGNMFCKFRSFDQYSGHSWAGGYADNDDGNNQESASESLFSWVGMYLWGEVSKQQKYIDAGAYGFTTEMEAVKQYWFDYDGDNWLDTFPFQGTGQVYGASYSYGTFFGGQPLYIYGIQWLPISEYLTAYGMEQEKCAAAYQGLLDETDDAIEKVMINANLVAEQMRLQGKSQDEINAYLAQEQHTADTYPTADTGWQHITWPFLSQTNPDAAFAKFNAGVNGVQKEDRANTLWFISAMDSIGHKTTDYVITGQTLSGSVFKKEINGKTVYTGEIWNPTTTVKTTFVVNSATGEKIGKVKVKEGSLVQFEIDEKGGFDLLLGNDEQGGNEEETTTSSGNESVRPPADVKEWIPDARFNLSLGKEASISSIYAGEGSQTTDVLTDGNLNSDYVSTDWNRSITEDYIIIDLGKYYKMSDIHKIAMQFKNDAGVFAEQYEIQVSKDGITFDQCLKEYANWDKTDQGFVSFDILTAPVNSIARFVKIKMIGHKNWGFQIREVAVLTANANAKPVFVEGCDNPAGLEVSSVEPLKIRYKIVAGEGQDGYQYAIHLDGKRVTDLRGAGEGTIDTTVGKHTVKVVSYYQGKISDGLSDTVEVGDGSLRNYCSTSLNYALGAKASIEPLDPKNEGTKDAKVLTDGNINSNYNMTVWGEDNATAILELQEAVDINDIHEVLIKFVNDVTYAKGFNIQFSEDGTNYESVYETVNQEYKDPVEVPINQNVYTQGEVNYVKVQFTKKGGNYGYQIREIAVLGDPDSYLPADPTGLALSSNMGGSITVQFNQPLDGTAMFNIYVDDKLVGLHLTNAGPHTLNHLDGGRHTVKVTAVKDNVESKGVTGKITIDNEAPYTTEADWDDDFDAPIVTRPETTTSIVTESESATQNSTETETTTAQSVTETETTTVQSVTETGVATTQKPTRSEITTTRKTEQTPKTTKIPKVKVTKASKKRSAKKFKVVLKKVTNVNGFQVKIYNNKKKAKKNKKAIVTKLIRKNTAKLKIQSKKLKNRKKLYVRVRAYRLSGKSYIFGAWSKVKKVKVQ